MLRFLRGPRVPIDETTDEALVPARKKCTQAGDDAFFAARAEGMSVAVAAMLAGCTRQALYQRRVTDRAFDARWLETDRALLVRSRAKAKRRRLVAPAFEAGRLSDAQLLARLKTLRPVLYRD
jgi:hypothetical protein